MSDIKDWRIRFIDYLQHHWTKDDAAHDIHHLHRVWRTCQLLLLEEDGTADELILLAACYFHDFIVLPKNDPSREKASLLSANRAAQILTDDFADFPKEKIDGVYHAIHAHSFSANVPVRTTEAAILQDADRMEALGAIGLARMFYTAGKMGSELFDPEDILAANRPLEDTRFSLDHIAAKLLLLPGTMKTKSGRRMAEKEAAFVSDFRTKLIEEAEGHTLHPKIS